MLRIHPDAEIGQLRPEDHTVYFALFTHQSLKPYLPETAIPKSIDHASKEIDRLIALEQSGQGKYWGIYHSNLLIGTLGLHSYAPLKKTVEISYELNPDFWNKGITTCAARYCLTQARRYFPNVEKILAYTLIDNIGSHRVVEKAGFHRIGIQKNDCIYHGKVIDRLLYAAELSND